MKKSAKIRETGIPNNRRISVFSFYLANLVYWAGFVICVLFKTHLSNANFIDFLTLWWKTVFESKLLFLQNRGLFLKLDSFSLIFAKPLYQKVRIDHRITFTFSWNSKQIMLNYQSDLGFLGFLWFSISLFILIIYKGSRFSPSASSYQLVPTYTIYLS